MFPMQIRPPMHDLSVLITFAVGLAGASAVRLYRGSPQGLAHHWLPSGRRGGRPIHAGRGGESCDSRTICGDWRDSAAVWDWIALSFARADRRVANCITRRAHSKHGFDRGACLRDASAGLDLDVGTDFGNGHFGCQHGSNGSGACRVARPARQDWSHCDWLDCSGGHSHRRLAPVVTHPVRSGGADKQNIGAVLGIAGLKILGLVAIVVVLGKWGIPWAMEHIARTGSRELFTLTVLVLAVGIAVGSARFFGVSMALGAFLAGLAVSRSEFATRAANDALPMRDAFAVLFFVSVGMLFDPKSLVKIPSHHRIGSARRCVGQTAGCCIDGAIAG